MGDVTLKCPLCCTKTFDSRELLVEHLASIIGNLFCPSCNTKWPSIIQLIEHLSHETCLQAQTVQLQPNHLRTIVLEKTSQDESTELQLTDSNLLEFKNAINTASTSIPVQNIDATEEVNNMYVELMKPSNQELQFIKDGDSQFVIITQDHEDTVVTKQNTDGTISLRSVKEMKMEAEVQSPEPEVEESQENLYSCNTCGVSFTSVIDHIQNYHNDQDVVVEEPMDETENQMPVEYESIESEEIPIEKQISRRVITETGVIVETTVDKAAAEENEEFTTILSTTEQQEKIAGPGSKRYMRINNLCDSVIRNLKQNDKNVTVTSHKVLIKEVMTKDGEMIKYYHCVFCNINVSSLSDFKTQQCKSSKYSCLQCPVSYDNAKSLYAHMKIHKVKTTDGTEKAILETFECEICSTVFPTNKSLKLHKRMHDPVKSRQIEAPKNSDMSEVRYLCTICEKMIPEDYRKIHENSHLNEQNLLNCGICNKKFSSEEYLDMHMNVHNLEKAPLTKQDQSLPYTCVYCDRRFARPHEKVKHERIHTGEKPHSCEICGKSFRVSYCLTLHMRTHTGARPYGCPHCGKRFKAHSVYNHHLLTHSEVRAYKCPYCPKAFKTSVQLAGHKNSHTKPFSCTHCNRPFASLYAVRVHTETHSRQNNLKFSCSLCGASYARAFALKDHIKQQHKDDILKTESGSVEEWVGETEGTTDGEIKSSLQALNKDIEMDQLDMPSDELIIPN